MFENFSTELIAFLSGIVITLLSGVGYSIKIWLDNKSILKECLFSLLKVQKALNFIIYIDMGKMRETILQRAQSEQQREFTKEEYDEAREYFDKFINTAFEESKSKFEQDLAQDYNSTVKKLSTIKPLLAYDLSSKLYMNKYLNSLEEVISTDTDYLNRPEVDYLKKTSQKPLVEEEREDLENYILKIAFRASKISWIKLKFFSDILSEDPFNMEQKMEEYFKRAKKHNIGE